MLSEKKSQDHLGTEPGGPMKSSHYFGVRTIETKVNPRNISGWLLHTKKTTVRVEFQEPALNAKR